MTIYIDALFKQHLRRLSTDEERRLIDALTFDIDSDVLGFIRHQQHNSVNGAISPTVIAIAALHTSITRLSKILGDDTDTTSPSTPIRS